MPRFNDILATGVINSKPRIRYNKPEGDPTRIPVMAIANIIVIRGIRKFGAVNERLRKDMPVIMSMEPAMVRNMMEWEAGDIVEIKGTLASVDIPKHLECPQCHSREDVPQTNYYINPIASIILERGLNPLESNDRLRELAEFSNRLTIAGRVDGELDLYTVPSTKQRILSYGLASERKYRNKFDREDNKYDYLRIKSYGKIADEDMKRLKKGAKVLLDGMIQVRNYEEKHTCPCCNYEYTIQRIKTEVIPYSTEYIQLNPTEEDLMTEDELLRKKAIAQEERLFGKALH